MLLKQYNKYFVVISSLLIIMSCNETKDTNSRSNIQDNADFLNKGNNPDIRNNKNNYPVISELEINKKNIKSSKKNVKVVSNNPIENKILTEFLPDNIPQTNKRPYKTGVNFEGEYKITTASIEFVFSNKGFLTFLISDYGQKSFIPADDLKKFDKPPTVSGRITEAFIINNGKGYSIWDEQINNGVLYVLLSDRIILRIDGTRMPESINSLQNYIKYFKINKLLKRINLSNSK